MNSISPLTAHITKQTMTASQENAMAFCVDDKYLPYALFVVEQIFLLEKLEFDICVCVNDLSKIPAYFLEKSIRFVEIQVAGDEKLPTGKLSLATYHRLFLTELFKDDYKYIIYLDADIYINRPFYKDLMKIIDSFNKDFCIAGAMDITEIIRVIEPHNKFLKKKASYLGHYYSQNHFYRNAGILVFNVPNCNKFNVGNGILNYAINNTELLVMNDQSAINLFLLDKLAILPFTYNWQLHKLTYQLTLEINPYIIHFIGENKPWALDNKYTKPYIAQYQNFLSQYFPSLASYPVTKNEQRKKNPKYTNPLRESISVFGQMLKNTFNPIDENASATSEQTTLVRNLLKQPPFI